MAGLTTLSAVALFAWGCASQSGVGGASAGSPVGLPERGAAVTSALPAGIDLETVDLEGDDLDSYALALVEEVN